MKKKEIVELPTKLLMVELGSAKRNKRVFVFAGVGIVVVAGGAVGVVKTIDTRDAAAREGAFGSLGACLLGEPLRAGEKPSARLLDAQLTVVGLPLDRRAKSGEIPWPASCAPLAFTLAEHAGGTPLAESAQAFGKALHADTGATADHGAEIDKVWADAAAQKLEPGPATGAPPAPKATPPLFANEAFQALPRLLSATFPLASVHEEPAPSGKLHFLVDQKDLPEGPVLCAVDAADPTIHCMKLPAAVATLSPGLRLFGTTEERARPFYFAGERGQMGIFPPDGKNAVLAAAAVGASSRADGSLLVAAPKEGTREVHLYTQPATGAVVERPLLQATDVDSPAHAALLWDWFVFRGSAKRGPSHLFARKLEGPGESRPAVDVGEIDEAAPPDKADRGEPQLSGCRSDEALAVRVRGARADTFAFFAGGRWSAPVKAQTAGGALTCRGIEAVETSVESAVEGDKNLATVNQSKCNSSGCTKATVGIRQMLAGIMDIAPADTAAIAAADVGGKLALVWNGGHAGGLRMRFAATERVKDAEDTVITDGRDPKSDAKLSTLVEMRVIPAGSFALLLLGTLSGVKAFRIDSAGKVTPLQSAM